MNAAGGSVASVDRTATTTDVIPAAPSMGTATPHLNSVTLAWTAPLANGGSPIISYAVFFGQPSTAATQFGAALPASTLTVEVTGLSAGTSYYFYVVGTNALGSSPASVNAFANTTNIVPGTPIDFTASIPSLNSITLNWTVPESNGGTPILGYEVFFGTTTDVTTKFGSTLASNATVVQVTGLNPGTKYYFAVRAINAAGPGPFPSPLANMSTTNLVPGVPTMFQVTSGVFSVTLSWTAPAANGGTDITGYHVYQVSGGSSVLLATLGLVTAYIDSGYTYNTIKVYQVCAVNAMGESARTEMVRALVLACIERTDAREMESPG